MEILLICLIIYLILGLSFLATLIYKAESFDLSDIGSPNFMIYPLAISFWWYWIFLELKK